LWLRISRLSFLLSLIASLLALRLHLLLSLLSCRALLLLRLNHLLPRSFTLGLLLLPLHLFLVLGPNRLAHYLALGLHVWAFSRALVRLLFAQVLQLLTRVLITSRGLFRQVRYLSLPLLLSSNIRWLGHLRWSGRTLIRHLQLLVSNAIVYWLDSHSLRQVLPEPRRHNRARHHRRIESLYDLPRDVDALAGFTCLKRDRAQVVDRQRIEYRSHAGDRLGINSRDNRRIDDSAKIVSWHHRHGPGNVNVHQSIHRHV
jgi:hypothetical protein